MGTRMFRKGGLPGRRAMITSQGARRMTGSRVLPNTYPLLAEPERRPSRIAPALCCRPLQRIPRAGFRQYMMEVPKAGWEERYSIASTITSCPGRESSVASESGSCSGTETRWSSSMPPWVAWASRRARGMMSRVVSKSWMGITICRLPAGVASCRNGTSSTARISSRIGSARLRE